MTPDLPKGKSLPDIFADFIRYMFDSAREFIKESEPMGDKIWERVKSDIHLILSHPNGWEGRQQEFLRKSVVKASIFTEEEALSRVSFVTEGEATFNFCMTDTKSGALLEVTSFLPFNSGNWFSALISSLGTRSLLLTSAVGPSTSALTQ